MIKTIKLLKGSWFGRLLISLLCISVLMLTMPAKAPAPTAVEYAVMLALIIVVCITDITKVSNEPWHVAYGVVANQLLTAALDAQDANTDGDHKTELIKLSMAIGSAKAMLGITSSCGVCDEIRTDLQQIIGMATVLRSEALGVVSGCHPNGKIQKSEECDPLIKPNGGCAEGNFCNDECLCEPSIIP